VKRTGPASGLEHGRDLAGHVTGTAGYIAPAVTVHPVIGLAHLVVPAVIPKRFLRRMRFTPVQLDHQGVFLIPDVVISPRPRVALWPVAPTSR
jgi:hypothetical protein